MTTVSHSRKVGRTPLKRDRLRRYEFSKELIAVFGIQSIDPIIDSAEVHAQIEKVLVFHFGRAAIKSHDNVGSRDIDGFRTSGSIHDFRDKIKNTQKSS
jgi:hypothetical protein